MSWLEFIFGKCRELYIADAPVLEKVIYIYLHIWKVEHLSTHKMSFSKQIIGSLCVVSYLRMFDQRNDETSFWCEFWESLACEIQIFCI